MDQLRFQLEMAAFDEKITLAELEQAKAAERVKELTYQKSRFQLDWFRMIAKHQQEAEQDAGELNNPENLFPYHYEQRYELGTNTFESYPLYLKGMIQDIAKRVKGHPLNTEDLDKIFAFLDSKHLLQRNPGDQVLQDSVQEYIKALRASRKVAARWQI